MGYMNTYIYIRYMFPTSQISAWFCQNQNALEQWEIRRIMVPSVPRINKRHSIEADVARKMRSQRGEHSDIDSYASMSMQFISIK